MKKEKDKVYMKYTKNTIKAIIINKLIRWNKWGAAHTENILGGIPRSARGNKITREAVKELVQDAWLIALIKTQEIHYSLNPEKAKDIFEFYEEHKERD